MSNEDREGWELWQKVMATAQPLEHQKEWQKEWQRKYHNHDIEVKDTGLKAKKLERKTAKPTNNIITAAFPPPHPIHSPTAKFDSNLLRKIKKRQQNFQAKIDLHGLDRQSAHHLLIEFITQQRRMDRRLVLVITGKGSGILRRDLPHWLEAPSLRHAIHAYDQALPQDGGEGAFYVYLKRQNKAS